MKTTKLLISSLCIMFALSLIAGASGADDGSTRAPAPTDLDLRDLGPPKPEGARIGWVPQEVYDEYHARPGDTSMDVFLESIPYVTAPVVYTDPHGGDDTWLLVCCWEAGGEWRAHIVDSTQEPLPGQDLGIYNSTVLDPQGFPHVIYYKIGEHYSGTLNHAWLDAAGWHSEVVDSGPATVDVGRWCCAALGYGEPYTIHIAYRWHDMDADQDYLRYARIDADGLHIEDITEAEAEAISICLDAAGRPTVFCWDRATGLLLWASHDGHEWYVSSLDWRYEYRVTSVCWDPTMNVPHFAGYNVDDGDLMYWHAWWGPPEPIDGTQGDDVGQGCSIARYSNGDVGISYHDATNRTLNYIYGEMFDWSKEVVDGSLEDPAGRFSCLKLIWGYSPCISYLAESDLAEHSRTKMTYLTLIGNVAMPFNWRWHFFTLPMSPTGSRSPYDLIYGMPPDNNIFRWNGEEYFWEVFPDDFETLTIGRGYLAYVFEWWDAGCDYEGFADFPTAYVEKYADHEGWTYVGMPRVTDLWQGEVVVYNNTTGEFRTAMEDDRSPEPWLNWNWIYYDYETSSYAICIYDGSGDDDTLHPGFGYYVYCHARPGVGDLTLIFAEIFGK